MAAQILYGSLFEKHPCISQLEKTEFPAACELDLSATCFISIVLFHLKGFQITLPPNAHDRFMHRLVIWWALLRAMYRQQQTKRFTPVEVTVEHLDNAMQLLSLEVLPFMPESLLWSSFFHFITDPMWLIPKMRAYKSGPAPYGTGRSKIWRILPLKEAPEGENSARLV